MAEMSGHKNLKRLRHYECILQQQQQYVSNVINATVKIEEDDNSHSEKTILNLLHRKY